MNTRIGIAINWSQLRDLMREYLDERGGSDEQVMRMVALSDFLCWLQKQQRLQQRETKETHGN